jgi:hypothetical protein
MARPTKLTERRLHRLQKAIAAGLPLKIATKGCGIHYSTFRTWLKRGEFELEALDPQIEIDPDEDPTGFASLPIHVRLVLLIEKAEFDAAMTAVVTVRRGLSPNSRLNAPAAWQSGAWLLERRYPNDFGRRLPPDQRHAEELSPEEYAERCKEALEAMDASIPAAPPDKGASRKH